MEILQPKRKMTISTTEEPESPTPTVLSPKMELRLRLLPRIAEFRLRNWIDPSEERQLLDVLSADNNTGSNANEEDVAAQWVMNRLAQVEAAYASRARGQKQEAVTRKKKGDARDNARKHLVENFRKVQDHKHDHDANNQAKIQAAVYDLSSPTQVMLALSTYNNFSSSNSSHHGTSRSHNKGKTEEEAVRDLFVEMCFFARLGFVQPPCCLHCAYHLGQKKQRQRQRERGSRKCQRLVVWRKDGNRLLQVHNDANPSDDVASSFSLRNNMVLVRCHVASRLLQGEPVISSLSAPSPKKKRTNAAAPVTADEEDDDKEGRVVQWKWNAHEKQLVATHVP